MSWLPPSSTQQMSVLRGFQLPQCAVYPPLCASPASPCHGLQKAPSLLLPNGSNNPLLGTPTPVLGGGICNPTREVDTLGVRLVGVDHDFFFFSK